MNKKDCLVLFLAVILLTGCHSIMGGPRLSGAVWSDQAVSLLSDLSYRERPVITFKGLGTVRLRAPDGVQVARMAWVGSTDGRLRMVVMGPTGQSLARLVYDGKIFYFLSQTDGKLYRKPCADPSLEPLTGVPVRVDEMVLYLAGLIPVYEYDTVLLKKGGADPGDALVLKKRFRGVVERICLDKSLTGVERVEVFSRERLVYRAVLEKVRDVNGHRIPFKLLVSKDLETGFSLAIDHCWTDISISQDMFFPGQP